jgi:DNA-binding SARP family transcriptional activator
VSRDGVPLADAAFGRQKARMLLAALLAAEGPVHRDALLEWFWPRLSPARGAAALNVTLHELRRALQPELEARSAAALVVAEGETVRLALGERDGWDVARFRALAARGSGQEDPPAVVSRLTDAEALYAGAFLVEWPYEAWAAAPRAALEETRLDVLERLADSLAACGRLPEAIGRYRHLLTLDREREGWHRALMGLYARAGERALALRQYHACRAVLRRTQGIDPGLQTRSFYAELLQETASG